MTDGRAQHWRLARCKAWLDGLWDRGIIGKSFPGALHQKFERGRRKSMLQSLRFGTGVGTVMCIFYFVVSGVGSPEQMFFRIQSALSALLAICLTLGAHYNRRIFGCSNAIVFLGMLHYIAYSTMTYKRAGYLLGLYVDRSEEEAYIMMLNYFVLAVCGHFNVLKLGFFLVVSIFAPLCWVVQVNVLGTEHGTQELCRMGVLYFVLCMLAFLGARRSHTELLSEFLRNARERSELLHALENASVPIMLVGANHGHTDLQVELWNQSLQELTQTVPKGSSFSALNCFFPKHRDVLAGNILQELESAQSTEPVPLRSKKQGLLIQVVGAAGVTWLQVDIWPVNMDQPMAIMLGSDVTHFVSKHSSLLHQAGEPPAKSDDKNTMRMFAIVDASSFVLLKCSVGFNVYFQQRMEAKTIMQWIPDPADKNAILAASSSVLDGNGPRVVVVQMRASDIRSHRTHSRRIWPKMKSVQITISLEDTNKEEENEENSGSSQNLTIPQRRIAWLRLELVGEIMLGDDSQVKLAMIPEKACSEPDAVEKLDEEDDTIRRRKSEPEENQAVWGSSSWLRASTHSEPARRSKFVIDSADPEPGDVGGGLGLNAAGSEPDSPGASPWTIGKKTASEPARVSTDMVQSGAGHTMQHARNLVADSSQPQPPCAPGMANGTCGPTRVMRDRVLEGCLVELARHLRKDSLEAALYYLHVSVAVLRSNLDLPEHKYFEACNGWECPSCYAMNDEEDEWCEICKIDRNVEQEEQTTPVPQQPDHLTLSM